MSLAAALVRLSVSPQSGGPVVCAIAGRCRPIAPPSPAVQRLRSYVPRRAVKGSSKEAEPAPESQEQPQDLFSVTFAFFSSGLAFLSGLLASLLQGSAPERDRPARIVQQLGAPPVDSQSDAPVYSLGPFPKCTVASDLRLPGRRITILTTAALPWRTGPAVNALLRALYLAKRGSPVVLRIPWLEPEAQKHLFRGRTFEDREAQEEYVRAWCVEHAGINPAELPLEIRWYDATYIEAVRSIFPTGDVSSDLTEGEDDVLIMEEPEHLCWFHEGSRWPELFRHVIGIVHTNYQVYLAGMGYEGLLSNESVRDSILLSFTSLVCSAYCDVTIKLSSAGVSLPNDVNCNVHGVREEFLRIGREESPAAGTELSSDDKADVYFVGKAVFPKGWSELLDLLEGAEGRLADLRIEGFGSGADFEAIAERATKLQGDGLARLEVHPEVDHADERLRSCSVLVNPSTSEILCTVTAEALAMRKRAVLPRHPSNRFFMDNFADRVHLFEPGSATSFEEAVRGALAAGRPAELADQQKEVLSWEAAIERLLSAAEVHVLSGPVSRPSEVRSSRLAYEVHHGIQKDTPSLSKLLKDATLKSRSPWEETLAQWRETEYGRVLLDQVWPSWGQP